MNNLPGVQICDQSGLTSLGSLTFDEILADSPVNKSVFVKARNDKGEDVVLIMDKKPFDLVLMPKFFTPTCLMRLSVQNDIYGSYEIHPPVDLNGTDQFT